MTTENVIEFLADKSWKERRKIIRAAKLLRRLNKTLENTTTIVEEHPVENLEVEEENDA